MKKNKILLYINIILIIVIMAMTACEIGNDNLKISAIDKLKLFISQEYRKHFGGSDTYADMQRLDGVAVLVDKADEDIVNTGETYDFPEEYYPYRTMLTYDGKRVYNQIYENAMELNESFALVNSIPADEFERVMCAVYNDQPELFWLETSYSYGYKNNGDVVSVNLVFNMSKDDVIEARRKFKNYAMAVISETKFIDSDLEKEKYVHDYIINNVTYDDNSEINQSAYSAIVNGSSVCAGYARAFQYIMIEIGIPCYYCTGYANGGDHAWNIVKIDDEFYNVDVSWDDYDIERPADIIRYRYFNLSNEEIGETHSRTGLSEMLD